MKRTCLPSPIGRGSVERARPGRAATTAGLPMPNGASALELLGEREPELVAGDDGVDALDAARGPRARAPRAACASNAARKRVDARRARSCSPAAARWPPWRSEVLGARRRGPPSRSKAGIERPEPGALARRRARSARTGGGGARRSARRRSRSRPGASPRRRARRPGARRARATCASASNRIRCLDVAALGVGARRAPRRSARARSASSVSSSSSAGVGAVQPAGGVDARREPEADRARVEPRRVDLRDAHQRAQARASRVARERAQAVAHEPAVLAAQRHAVGDRGQRDEVEVRVGARPGRGPRPRSSAPRELVARRRPRTGPGTGSRRRAGCTIGASGSAPSARGVWWSVTTTSMPGRARGRDLVDRGDRAVGGDSSRVPRAASRSTVARREAVAVLGAAGQVPVDVGAERAQRAHEDRRRARRRRRRSRRGR